MFNVLIKLVLNSEAYDEQIPGPSKIAIPTGGTTSLLQVTYTHVAKVWPRQRPHSLSKGRQEPLRDECIDLGHDPRNDHCLALSMGTNKVISCDTKSMIDN